jgi:hypothetical protein
MARRTARRGFLLMISLSIRLFAPASRDCTCSGGKRPEMRIGDLRRMPQRSLSMSVCRRFASLRRSIYRRWQAQPDPPVGIKQYGKSVARRWRRAGVDLCAGGAAAGDAGGAHRIHAPGPLNRRWPALPAELVVFIALFLLPRGTVCAASRRIRRRRRAKQPTACRTLYSPNVIAMAMSDRRSWAGLRPEDSQNQVRQRRYKRIPNSGLLDVCWCDVRSARTQCTGVLSRPAARCGLSLI